MLYQENPQADLGQTEDLRELPKAPKPSVGPPTATIARRAKSYSDFYVAARSQLKRDAVELGKSQLLAPVAGTEVQFREWFGKIEGELLEAAQGAYT